MAEMETTISRMIRRFRESAPTSPGHRRKMVDSGKIDPFWWQGDESAGGERDFRLDDSLAASASSFDDSGVWDKENRAAARYRVRRSVDAVDDTDEADIFAWSGGGSKQKRSGKLSSTTASIRDSMDQVQLSLGGTPREAAPALASLRKPSARAASSSSSAATASAAEASGPRTRSSAYSNELPLRAMEKSEAEAHKSIRASFDFGKQLPSRLDTLRESVADGIRATDAERSAKAAQHAKAYPNGAQQRGAPSRLGGADGGYYGAPQPYGQSQPYAQQSLYGAPQHPPPYAQQHPHPYGAPQTQYSGGSQPVPLRVVQRRTVGLGSLLGAPHSYAAPYDTTLGGVYPGAAYNPSRGAPLYDGTPSHGAYGVPPTSHGHGHAEGYEYGYGAYGDASSGGFGAPLGEGGYAPPPQHFQPPLGAPLHGRYGAQRFQTPQVYGAPTAFQHPRYANVDDIVNGLDRAMSAFTTRVGGTAEASLAAAADAALAAEQSDAAVLAISASSALGAPPSTPPRGAGEAANLERYALSALRARHAQHAADAAQKCALSLALTLTPAQADAVRASPASGRFARIARTPQQRVRTERTVAYAPLSLPMPLMPSALPQATMGGAAEAPQQRQNGAALPLVPLQSAAVSAALAVAHRPLLSNPFGTPPAAWSARRPSRGPQHHGSMAHGSQHPDVATYGMVYGGAGRQLAAAAYSPAPRRYGATPRAAAQRPTSDLDMARAESAAAQREVERMLGRAAPRSASRAAPAPAPAPAPREFVPPARTSTRVADPSELAKQMDALRASSRRLESALGK